MQSQRSIFLCSYLCFHPLPPLSAAIQANESCSGQQQLNEWSAAIQTVIDALGVRCFSLFSFPSFLPGFLLSCLHVFLLFALFFNSLSLLIATSSKLGCSCLPLMVGKRSRALPLIFKDCVWHILWFSGFQPSVFRGLGSEQNAPTVVRAAVHVSWLQKVRTTEMTVFVVCFVQRLVFFSCRMFGWLLLSYWRPRVTPASYCSFFLYCYLLPDVHALRSVEFITLCLGPSCLVSFLLPWPTVQVIAICCLHPFWAWRMLELNIGLQRWCHQRDKGLHCRRFHRCTGVPWWLVCFVVFSLRFDILSNCSPVEYECYRYLGIFLLTYSSFTTSSHFFNKLVQT